jgi:hypothetical protein
VVARGELFVLSLERPRQATRWLKEVTLPSPRVRFLPSQPSPTSSDEAPAPLVEEEAETTFGLLEHEALRNDAASAAVNATLMTTLTVAQKRQLENAASAPPDGLHELQVGDEVLHSTSSTEDGESVDVVARIMRVHAPISFEEEVCLSIEWTLGGVAQSARVPSSEVRYTGFLAQMLRSWGPDERVRRQDARLLLPPPAGHAEGKVPMKALRDYWLNTTVVNCVGLALSEAFPAVNVLPMGLGELALRRDFRLDLPRTQRICQRLVDFRRNDLFGDHVEQWLLPCCRQKHIFGISVHFRLQRIIVIDSCGGRQVEPSDARRAAQLLTHELHRLGGQGSFDWTGWKVVSLGRLSPQQGSDAVNCGIYTLACFWALAHGVSFSAICVADMNRWRERFMLWLMDGGRSLRRK